MGKFLQMMSQNDSTALRRRASQINTQAKIAQQGIIQDLENQKANLEIQIQNLTDFAPETTDALRPGVKGWDPITWAKKLQAAKTGLYNIQVALEIANATMEEFFGDDDEDKDVAE